MTSVPLSTVFRLPFSSLGNRFGILPNSRFYGPQGHRGQDFHAVLGTPVPSISDGVVSEVVWSTALGNVVIVKYHVPAAADVFGFYCHLSATSVRAGQVVRIGRTIGKIGSTGTASSGPHLHLAMSHEPRGGISGDVFDPLAFIRARLTAPPSPTRPVQAKYTKARPGEGLSVIGARVHVSLARMIALNSSDVLPPEYIVRVGQRIRYA